jgi:hypothetical protein
LVARCAAVAVVDLDAVTIRSAIGLLNCEYVDKCGMINDLGCPSRCSRDSAHVLTLRLISGRHRVDDVFVATPCSILRVCDVARRAAR